MRLMMCEYTATPEKGPSVHGVCNRRRLEYLIEDGSIVAKMIEDDAAAKLIAKWEGDIEPAPKKKSPPEVQVPASVFAASVKSTQSQAVIDATAKANAAFKPAPPTLKQAFENLNPTVSVVAPSMPPSGITAGPNPKKVEKVP